jgi:hypothetical protein
MLFVATADFYCEECRSEIKAGKPVDLTFEQAEKYKGCLRMTTLPKRRSTRSYVRN